MTDTFKYCCNKIFEKLYKVLFTYIMIVIVPISSLASSKTVIPTNSPSISEFEMIDELEHENEKKNFTKCKL